MACCVFNTEKINLSDFSPKVLFFLNSIVDIKTLKKLFKRKKFPHYPKILIIISEFVSRLLHSYA